MIQTELSQSNQRELRKLILSIRANANRLDLLLAICDDRNLQEDLIQHYEAELKQQGIATHRTRLDLRQPSLKATLAALVQREPGLQTQDQAVVTVLGASELLGVRLTDEKSEQEKFFFSLQWTRESLRDFHFPVVVWLSEAVATSLSRQAQDFWSWRSGVFEFEPDAQFSDTPELLMPTQAQPSLDHKVKPTGSIPDLQQQIAELKQQNPQSPLLVTLYNDLGDAYRQQYAHEPALQFYEKALKLAQTLKDQAGQARSLLSLGLTLKDSGRYAKAIAFCEQALAIFKEIGNRNGRASTLTNLGGLYRFLGQYQQAINLHQQALAINREIGDRQGESASLTGLGNAYQSLGQYNQAIDFYQQSLVIQREIGNRLGEANSLLNLGNIYLPLGRYAQVIDSYQQSNTTRRRSPMAIKHYKRQCTQVIDFYQQSLAIHRELGDRQGEANSLGNLGNAYLPLGQYAQAIDFHQQSLAIHRELGDRNGEATSLNNLGNAYYSLGQYSQAIDFQQQALEIKREIGDRNGEAMSLNNLGNAYQSLGQYAQAIDFLQQALEITREIGDRRGEANSLFNMGLALARLDRHYEVLQSYQQALAIYEDLKLDYKVEQCKTAIAERNRIIAFERRTAPKIGDDATDDGTRAISKRRSPVFLTRQSLLQRLGLGFAVGLAIALLIWWLRR